MKIKTLHVNISNKIATYQKRDGDIVCGNKDYQIKFAFDDDWKDVGNKVARFEWNGHYFDVDITDDICPVPKILGAERITVGVYADDIYTTTEAEIGCKLSCLCGSQTPSTENDKYYANEAKEAADRAEETVKEAKEAAEGAMEYTDEVAKGKLDKVTEPTDGTYVYAVKNGEQNIVKASSGVDGGLIMCRDADGRSKVAEPKENEHIANKKYVDDELAKFDFIKVVNALPKREDALPNKIYLVPKADTQNQDLFDEWVWINKGTEEEPNFDWEWVTTKQLEVDLTPYAKKTDLRGKVDILNFFPGEWRVYCTYMDNIGNNMQNSIIATSIDAGDTLMRRDSRGQANVKTPTANMHIANKKYVDDTNPVKDGVLTVGSTKITENQLKKVLELLA